MDQQGPPIVNGQPAKRGRPRAKRAKIQAVAATLNPMASDFRQLTIIQGVDKTRQWMSRYDEVAARPEYSIQSVRTLTQAEDGEAQILKVVFQGSFVLDGTWPMIIRALHARIVEAVETSYEADAAAQIAAGPPTVGPPHATAAAVRPACAVRPAAAAVPAAAAGPPVGARRARDANRPIIDPIVINID